MALLSALEIPVDIPFFQGKVSHHTFHYGDQALAVGFSTRKKTKLSH
jgi:hypothetical protein